MIWTLLCDVTKIFCSGVIDSVQFQKSIFYFWVNKRLRLYLTQCWILNGLLFAGFISLMDMVIVPAMIDTTTNFVPYLLQDIYYLLWVYPIYVISFMLNTVWYQEIATEIQRYQNLTLTKQESTPDKLPDKKQKHWLKRIVEQFAEDLFLILISFVYLIQMGLIVLVIQYIRYWTRLQLLIYLEKFVYFLLLTWLYAQYAFDYRWTNLQWSLKRKIQVQECSWIYLCGFGSISSIVTLYFPKFIGYGFYSFLFPFVMASAFHAKIQRNPVHSVKNIQMYYYCMKTLNLLMKIFGCRS